MIYRTSHKLVTQWLIYLQSTAKPFSQELSESNPIKMILIGLWSGRKYDASGINTMA